MTDEGDDGATEVSIADDDEAGGGTFDVGSDEEE